MVSNSWWMSMRVRGALLALAVGVGVLALSARAAPAASVGHSGWFWGNPLPQGNALSGIDFAGARGYAAGAFGTVLRTDDGGGSWTGISTGITADLVRVRAIDANTVVIGGGCSLRRSNDGGQSFARLPWTASDANCPSPIASFHFVDGAVGYLLTLDGSVFRTTDGGQTFSRQTSVPGTPSAGGQRVPSDIFFTNATTGFAIAPRRRRADLSHHRRRQLLGRGGEHQSAALRGHVRDSRWTDSRSATATGSYSTIDGGATWSPEPLAGVPGPLGLRSIDCADATTCLIAEDSGGRLVRTTDAGATGIAVSPSSQKITAAAFSSAARAVAVGAEGATVVSGDGGQTWSPVGARIAGTAFGRLRATSAALANSGRRERSARAHPRRGRDLDHGRGADHRRRPGCVVSEPGRRLRNRLGRRSVQDGQRRGQLADPRPRGLDRSGGRAGPRPEHRATDRAARRQALDRWRRFVRVHRRQGRSERSTGERRACRHGGARVRRRGAPAVDQRRSELEAGAAAAEKGEDSRRRFHQRSCRLRPYQ